MSGKIKSAEEYTAEMDRMVNGLAARASESRISHRKWMAIWSTAIVIGTALLLWVLQVFQGGSGFSGKLSF